MAEKNFTLTTFYSSWKTYQDHIKEALAPLTTSQLELRAAPHLRSIGEIALHIIGCRIGWFTFTLREIVGEELGGYLKRNEIALQQQTSISTAAELVLGLELTWQLMADCLARWSPDEMQQIFPDEQDDGTQVDVSRNWVVWHVLEHDLHHGGELSFTLGMHGLAGLEI